MGSADVSVAGVANQADDFKAGTACRDLRFSNDFPTGFSPWKYGLAKASLTMATPGDGSSARKSLPSRRGIFMVSSQPGETFRK